MVKFAAVAVLVLVPLLWGAIMVPVLDFFEKKILLRSGKSGK
jgi:hypothetical protein